MHVTSDALIWLSYVVIALTLVYLVRRSRYQIPFHWMFLAFGTFIIACGFTHLMEVVTLWNPVYWLSGYVKVITAIASVTTAVILPFVIPRITALAESAAASEQVKIKLEASNRELEAFAYSVSHDLRAPLRRIDGFSQILQKEFGAKLEGDAGVHLREIHEGIVQMDELIDGLLRFCRLGQQELRWTTVDLNQLVRSAIRDLGAGASAAKIQWTLGNLPQVGCDPVLARQVIENLLANAVKFTGPRQTPEIEIGQRPVDGQRVFYVRDNGVGFDMKYASKLFGVFQRLHGEEFEGTGVGLALVHRIVTRHGGRIWVESQVGEGTTFYFTLGPGPGPATGFPASAAGVQQSAFSQ